jgi:TRAP-type mannitol/chloroaromatic compound transport system permease large subunit
VAPNVVSTGMIYKGALPFVALQVLAIAILFIFPEVVTWLPSVIY